MVKCEKCGSKDVIVMPFINRQEMCTEYIFKCNKCGSCVKFKGAGWCKDE